MANLYRHIHIRKLTDLLDERVERRTSVGRALRASRGKDDTRGDVGATKTHQDLLREATTYASFARGQEIYLHKARRMDVPAYTIAIMDWFEGPRVLEIDVDAWIGEPGQAIRVKARDNIKVASVSVVIRDAEENVLEMGKLCSPKQTAPGGTIPLIRMSRWSLSRSWRPSPRICPATRTPS